VLSYSKPANAKNRRSLAVWALFCALAGAMFLLYALSSLAAGRGVFVMPLDDVYIHFQYARQIAAGQPYVYNPGQPPSSGATSFLYPYILAVGYLLGFQGLNLGLWAMAVGGLALVGATWLVYRLVKQFDGPYWLAIATALAFAVSGPVAWHFLSGMETGLVVLFTLGTLYAALKILTPSSNDSSGRDLRPFVVFATLLALIRPEGGVLAVLAVGAVVWRILTPPPDPLPEHGEGEGMPDRNASREKFARHPRVSFSGLWTRRSVPLVIPVLAVGVQPAVNVLLTGSAVASGNAAKSIFGIVPFSWGEVVRRVLENFGRTWAEIATGISPREGMYIAPVVGLLALVGLVSLLRRREWRLMGVLVLAWLVSGTLAIATLDTAFWHFKRYQMPFLALLFPLAGWGMVALTPRSPLPQGEGEQKQVSGRFSDWRQGLVYAALVAAALGAVWTGGQFWRYYLLNGDYVYLQPLQMARWLQANTPPDAVVAVHDTGMMRYMGGRTTIDMVGLTTPGAADYWRNGPGAVAEFLIQKRPDYIAAYGPGHGFGLGMLADTAIYGKPLASFPVEIDNSANVALAAGFQGIYKPDWSVVAANGHEDISLQPYGSFYEGMTDVRAVIPIDGINVGDIASEGAAHYRWRDDASAAGFPTEVHQFDYIQCTLQSCHLVDGGRLINGEESFDLRVHEEVGQTGDAVLVTRVHPQFGGTFDVYADDTFLGTRVIPQIPGKWLEISTYIPNQVVHGLSTRIHIVPHVPGGYYMPYYHWAYGAPPVEPKPDKPLAVFQNGAIQVGKADIQYQRNTKQLNIQLDWYTPGNAQGDYKLFVHVLDDKGEIAGQADTYPGLGTLPPGNWLPGVLHDQIVVDLGGAKPGRYRVVIGLYNPYTFERLEPTGGDEQRRLTIGEITLP
jgi:hypothetical protein